MHAIRLHAFGPAENLRDEDVPDPEPREDTVRVEVHASELVRRAEQGETVLVTVSGRPTAVIGPVKPAQWRRYDEIAALFAGADDEAWRADRGRLDDEVRDPWR